MNLATAFEQVVPLNKQASCQGERCIVRLKSYQSSMKKDQDYPISLVQSIRDILCYGYAKYNSQVINIPVSVVDYLKLTIL